MKYQRLLHSREWFTKFLILRLWSLITLGEKYFKNDLIFLYHRKWIWQCLPCSVSVRSSWNLCYHWVEAHFKRSSPQKFLIKWNFYPSDYAASYCKALLSSYMKFFCRNKHSKNAVFWKCNNTLKFYLNTFCSPNIQSSNWKYNDGL